MTETAAAGKVPSLELSSSSNHSQNHNHPRTSNDNGADQLSEDLALFLANPSLRAALADGSLDLASYSSTVEKELYQLETACIQQYRAKATEIAALQTDLSECQTVLASLNEMLLGFQADLGGLSGEIRTLQTKSRALDVQLRNRQAACRGLSAFLKHVVVSPNLAHAITTGTVNPIFCQAVQEVNQIYKDCQVTTAAAWASGLAPADTAAGQEMQTKVQALRMLGTSSRPCVLLLLFVCCCMLVFVECSVACSLNTKTAIPLYSRHARPRILFDANGPAATTPNQRAHDSSPRFVALRGLARFFARRQSGHCGRSRQRVFGVHVQDPRHPVPNLSGPIVTIRRHQTRGDATRRHCH